MKIDFFKFLYYILRNYVLNALSKLARAEDLISGTRHARGEYKKNQPNSK